MKGWLSSIAKRKMMLEAWQGEVIKWNSDLEKWRVKIQGHQGRVGGFEPVSEDAERREVSS
jgi:hypothetical protein